MNTIDIIMDTLKKLNGKYIHKVMVYAMTLLEIQEEQQMEAQKRI